MSTKNYIIVAVVVLVTFFGFVAWVGQAVEGAMPK